MGFTLETLEDFDQTIFSRGTGWAIIFEIHNAILARAQVTGHSLRNTIATPFSGLLWLEEGYDPARPELRTKLTQLYSWVQSLIGGQTGLRWTETSGRSAEWTLASITADIGMGDFEDLIVKPQRPEPLVWLIAALNRLRYPKITVNNTLALSPVGEVASRGKTGSYGDLDTEESTWDELIASAMNYSNVSYNRVGWVATSVSGGYFGYTETYSAGGITHASTTGRSALITKANDYGVFSQRSWYVGPDFEIVVGSSEPTSIMSAYWFNPNIIVEATGVDININGSEQVAITVATPIPGDVPFNGYFPSPYTGSQAGKYGYVFAEVRQIIFYCDLPDVMGIGELDAPVPVVAGDGSET